MHEIGSVLIATTNNNKIDECLRKEVEEDEDAEATWALVADSGFQGIQHTHRAILPQKKPPGRELLRTEVNRNNLIAKVRVICENFYCRLSKKFKIMDIKYCYDKENYHFVFSLCVALVNFDLLHHPLRRN